jgi:anti-sigma factor RsiW
MSTNDIHLLTGAYVLDSLDDADREVFSRHLSECEGCAGEIAELRETVVRLADDSWAVPPPRMRQNVLDQIRTTRQLPPVPPKPVAAWRKRAAYGLAAAILAVVAGGGTYLVQEQRVRDAQEEARRLALRAEKIQGVLTAPDAAVKAGTVTGGGRVTVVSSQSRNAAVVLLADAGTPSPQQAYEFWTIEKGTARPAALLGPGQGSGTVLVEGIGTADTLGMTLEKAGGATVPTEPILAAIAMT